MMRVIWWILTCLVVVGCGDGIDKKGPDVADNNSTANNANNITANNTTASNNANNTIAPTNNANNTVGPTNNVNNTIVPNNSNNGDPWTCYTDADGDGWGTNAQVLDTFCADVGLVLDGGDCNDDDDTTYPGAAELCDDLDHDCDGRQVTIPTVCATIQEALDIMAVTMTVGEIVVEPGTYRENIDFKGAPVRLVGGGPQTTTIDGSGNAWPTVRFNAQEGADTVLEGFTITGGSGELTTQGRRGGGIFIDEAHPTLRNLVVRGNTAGGDSGYGGGISMLRSSSLLERVDVVANSAGYYGGGIYVALSDAELRQVRMIDNDSLYGGGLAIYYSDAVFVASAVLSNQASYGGGAVVQGNAPTLENIAWVGNLADQGGALSLFSDTTVAITNNTFSGNLAESGGAIFINAGTPSVRYCNFFDNGASPLTGLSFANTVATVQLDPTFASVTGAAELWDLHLNAGSPLIDTGSTDIDDFDGTRSDIGAHGGPYGDW